MTPLSGLKVYRNQATGIFIHRCQNLRVENSIFADNYSAIDLDRAEGNQIANTTIIGLSPSYKALMVRQPGVSSICFKNSRVGIDLHTWQKEPNYIGAEISDVVMSGFNNADPYSKCTQTSSISFDPFVSTNETG
jgi:parallel beta-helix repeat protein